MVVRNAIFVQRTQMRDTLRRKLVRCGSIIAFTLKVDIISSQSSLPWACCRVSGTGDLSSSRVSLTTASTRGVAANPANEKTLLCCLSLHVWYKSYLLIQRSKIRICPRVPRASRASTVSRSGGTRPGTTQVCPVHSWGGRILPLAKSTLPRPPPLDCTPPHLPHFASNTCYLLLSLWPCVALAAPSLSRICSPV